MRELTAFLLERIAEDEAEVQSLANDYPSFRDRHGWWRNGDDATIELGMGRALAECEAKRRIVGRHDVVDASGGCAFCGEPAPCEHLRILATVYADHPDYREEWRA